MSDFSTNEHSKAINNFENFLDDDYKKWKRYFLHRCSISNNYHKQFYS